ncbi:disulfide bond formation protein DsbB [Conservatibacter flavescens]|uniref:Disulfide bond formation protein B n=1 Tax=Conservatibacter flavescens TaxID=28161 RepID=A0A2M8S3Q9_9PAST|nr:disulfide bond formation protein DsbB [Conservatibacter flavescens]PJG85782.1 disulfide bond formation protein DsbB [Conservatibacter flavescens]
MLKMLKALSVQRTGWFLLVLSGVLLELTALYFQYGMQLQPCVMCIYERVALFGIIVAGLIGMIAPRFFIIRFFALIIGLACAIKGVLLALTHVDYQMNPAPWKQCSIFAEFPETLPLDKWLPVLFQPTGSCSEISWEFLGITMAQWLVVIFAFYSLLLLLVLISQVHKSRTQRRLFN